jgi:hypothetical protein
VSDARKRATDAAYTAIGLQVLALRAVASCIRTAGPVAGDALEQAGLVDAVTEVAPEPVLRWLGLEPRPDAGAATT